MNLFWERLQYLCKAKGISPTKVVNDLEFSSGVMTHWKNGKVPRNSTIKRISDYFGVPMAFFESDAIPINIHEEMRTGEEQPSIYPVQGLCSMPVVGSVRAGYGASPMLDYEDEYVSIPTDQMRGYKASECRLIRVRGDSMYPKILDGDLVLIHVQPEVESDETAVVFNGGDEATIKKIRIFPDHIEMIPANNQYETKIVAGNDLSECRIYGKVLSLIRSF